MWRVGFVRELQVSQFQAGKWTLGFVGVLLLAAALSVGVVFFVEPNMGRWGAAAVLALASLIVALCALWVQKRYGRSPDA